MEKSRLQKLTLKLEDEFKPGNTDDLWVSYRAYSKTHADFFSKLDVHSYLKLFIYLYSYVNTKNFKLAEHILENMFFAYLLERTDSSYSEDCGRCNGEGRRDCYECDGSGYETCDECDGEGSVTCNECDGEGQIEDENGDLVKCDECNGNKIVECDTCGGDGQVDCGSCGGNGREECHECYGDGTIEIEDKFEYNTFLVCSWDKDFYNRCELTENKMEITISNSDFHDLEKKIILSENTDYEYLTEDLETEELYCLYVSDNPNIYVSTAYNFQIKLGWKPSLNDYVIS